MLSQKEPEEALSFFLVLEAPLVEAINSREDVGEAGCYETDVATGEVTMGSSLGGSTSL